MAAEVLIRIRIEVDDTRIPDEIEYDMFEDLDNRGYAVTEVAVLEVEEV